MVYLSCFSDFEVQSIEFHRVKRGAGWGVCRCAGAWCGVLKKQKQQKTAGAEEKLSKKKEKGR